MLVLLAVVIILLGLAMVSPGARWVAGAVFLIIGVIATAVGILGLQEISQYRAGLGWLQLVLSLLPEFEETSRNLQLTIVLGAASAALGFVLVMWAAASSRLQPVPAIAAAATVTRSAPTAETGAEAAPTSMPGHLNKSLIVVGFALAGVVGLLVITISLGPSLPSVDSAPAKPSVISHGLEGASKIGDYRLRVWADVRNDGKAGIIVLEATVHQGSQEWTKDVKRYLKPGEVARMEVMFEEARLLGGQATHEVRVYGDR